MSVFGKSIPKAKRRRRGVALFWLITLLGSVGALFAVNNIAEETAKKTQEYQYREQVRIDNIVTALNDYAINRADIERMPVLLPSANADIVPRLLLLPCPDNLSDTQGRDGIQDATCGATVAVATNRTNDILGSGSRFGLLPWARTPIPPAAAPNRGMDPGLGFPFADGTGNNFWYAVARNVVPKTAAQREFPLNLHHLSNAPADDWLQVVKLTPAGIATVAGRTVFTESASTLSKIAAVVIAPGGIRVGRIPDGDLSSENATQRNARAAGALDSLDSKPPGNAAVVRYENNNNDGMFVDAQRRNNFDDRIEYISAEEWWQEGGEFVRRYQTKVGVTEIHNRPAPDSPLDRIRRMIIAYHNLLQFYPTPAKNIPVNITSTTRLGAKYQTGASSITVFSPMEHLIVVETNGARTTLDHCNPNTAAGCPITVAPGSAVPVQTIGAFQIANYTRNVRDRIRAHVVGTVIYQPTVTTAFDVLLADPLRIAVSLAAGNSVQIIDDDDSKYISTPSFIGPTSVTVGIFCQRIRRVFLGEGVAFRRWHPPSITDCADWVPTSDTLRDEQLAHMARLGVEFGDHITLAQYARIRVTPSQPLSTLKTEVFTSTLLATVINSVNLPATMNLRASAIFYTSETQEEVFGGPVGASFTSYAVRGTAVPVNVSDHFVNIPDGRIFISAQMAIAYGEDVYVTTSAGGGFNISSTITFITVVQDNGSGGGIVIVPPLVTGDVIQTNGVGRLDNYPIGSTVTLTIIIGEPTVNAPSVDIAATGFLNGVLDPPLTVETAVQINTSVTLNPGDVLIMPGETTMTIAPNTPLVPPPATTYGGWLSQARSPNVAPNFHELFYIPALATAVSFSPARYTYGSDNITLSGGDKIFIPPNQVAANQMIMGNVTVQLENGSAFDNTLLTALLNPQAEQISFDKGQLAAFLLVDAIHNNTVAVRAPAIVFPYNRGLSQLNYPPELNIANYYEPNIDDTDLNITLSGKQWVDPDTIGTRIADTEIPTGFEDLAGEFLSVTLRHRGSEFDTDRPILVDDTDTMAFPLVVGANNIYQARQNAFAAFLADHPMHYAASGNCLYGGNACIGNIRITVEMGATIALSQPYVFPDGIGSAARNTVFAQDGMKHLVEIRNGLIAMTPDNITIAAAKTPAMLFEQSRVQQVFTNGEFDATETEARAANIIPVNVDEQAPSHLFIQSTRAGITRNIEAILQEGQVISNGRPLILQAGTPIIARSNDNIVITNVAALIAFSPAPLTRAECGDRTRTPEHPIETALPAALGGGVFVDQTDIANADHMTDLCAWLDATENSDSDNIYVIKAGRTNNNLSQSNDFFMFFGGQPNL